MKKQIAFIHHRMFVGGSEKVLINLLKALNYDYYDVSLFLTESGGGLFDQIPPQVNIQILPDPKAEPHFGKILNSYLRSFQLVSLFKALYYRIDQLLHRKNWYRFDVDHYKLLPKVSQKVFDAVFAYEDGMDRKVWFYTYRLFWKKKYVWFHNSLQELASKDLYLQQEYARCDGAICVSESVQKNVERVFPFLAGKTHVIYNLLDVDQIRALSQANPDDNVVDSDLVSVGRLSEEKAHKCIPEIAKILTVYGFTGKWYIVGEGPEYSNIEKEIEKHKVADRVILTGVKINPYPYIGRCGVFVQTSITEGYCTATLEAKALCRPVVTTDVPGMQEQITNGFNGLIVPIGDTKAIADAIWKLLIDKDFSATISKRLSEEDQTNRSELKKLDKLLGI